MVEHIRLGTNKFHRLRHINAMVNNGLIKLAGNKKLKIYGTLSCQSGKKMLDQNRIFFSSEEEALQQGFRPCGHCMRAAYLIWKNAI